MDPKKKEKFYDYLRETTYILTQNGASLHLGLIPRNRGIYLHM